MEPLQAAEATGIGARDTAESERSAPSDAKPSTAARTCSTCSRAKVKCDRALPRCGRCVRLGVECAVQARGKKRPLQSLVDTSLPYGAYSQANGEIYLCNTGNDSNSNEMGAGPGEYYLTGSPPPQQMSSIAAPYNAWHGARHIPGAAWAQETIQPGPTPTPAWNGSYSDQQGSYRGQELDPNAFGEGGTLAVSETCAACARTKVKCDKQKPVCSRCARLRIPCTARVRVRRRASASDRSYTFQRGAQSAATLGQPLSGTSPSGNRSYGAAAAQFQPFYGHAGALAGAPFSALQGVPPFASSLSSSSSSSSSLSGRDFNQAASGLPPQQALQRLVSVAQQKPTQDLMQDQAQEQQHQQRQQQQHEQQQPQEDLQLPMQQLQQLQELQQLQRVQQLRQEHELRPHFEEKQQQQALHSLRRSPLAVSALLAGSAPLFSSSPMSSNLPSPLIQPSTPLESMESNDSASINYSGHGIENSSFELDMDASYEDRVSNGFGGFGSHRVDTGGLAGSFDVSAASSANGSNCDKEKGHSNFNVALNPVLKKSSSSLGEEGHDKSTLKKAKSVTGSSSDEIYYSSRHNSLDSNRSSKSSSVDSGAPNHSTYGKMGRLNDQVGERESKAHRRASFESFEAARSLSEPGASSGGRAAPNGTRGAPEVPEGFAPGAAPFDQLGSGGNGTGYNGSCVLLFAMVVDNAGQQNSVPIPVGTLTLPEAASWGIFSPAVPPTEPFDGRWASAASNLEDGTAEASAAAAAAAGYNLSLSDLERNNALAHAEAQAAAYLAAQSANQAPPSLKREPGPTLLNYSSHAASSSSCLPSNARKPSLSNPLNSRESTPPASPFALAGAPPEPCGPPPPITNGGSHGGGEEGKPTSSGNNLRHDGDDNDKAVGQADRLGARAVSVDTMGVIEALSGLRYYSATNTQQNGTASDASLTTEQEHRADEIFQARAQAHAYAHAQAQGQAHLQAFAKAQALEQARALAHIAAQARAQMQAKARAQALAEAHSQAEANAHALAQALAQAQLYSLDKQPFPTLSLAAAADSEHSKESASRMKAQATPSGEETVIAPQGHSATAASESAAPTEPITADAATLLPPPETSTAAEIAKVRPAEVSSEATPAATPSADLKQEPAVSTGQSNIGSTDEMNESKDSKDFGSDRQPNGKRTPPILHNDFT